MAAVSSMGMHETLEHPCTVRGMQATQQSAQQSCIVRSCGAVYIKASSARTYSPMSAWCSTTVPVGSISCALSVLCAATPKPSGVSFMLRMITPAFAVMPSVMRARPDLTIWFPYKNVISAEGLTHTLCCEVRGARVRGEQGDASGTGCLTCACFASKSSAVMRKRNFPDLVNFPKHVPMRARLSLAMFVAMRMIFSLRKGRSLV